MACVTNFLEQKALTKVNIGQFNKKDKKNQDIIKPDQTLENHIFFWKKNSNTIEKKKI